MCNYNNQIHWATLASDYDICLSKAFSVISPGLFTHTSQPEHLYQTTFPFSVTICISKLMTSAGTLGSPLLLSASTSSDSFLITDLPLREGAHDSGWVPEPASAHPNSSHIACPKEGALIQTGWSFSLDRKHAGSSCMFQSYCSAITSSLWYSQYLPSKSFFVAVVQVSLHPFLLITGEGTFVELPFKVKS